MMRRRTPNFDRIAPFYRWLEYCTFGPLLERCRFARLPELKSCRHALILGDGDGRFLERLLAGNPCLIADVVDVSPVMLGRAEQRTRHLNQSGRTSFHCADARGFLPACGNTGEAGKPYDLVVTHFFLDCLEQQEVEELAARIATLLTPNGLWLVSEFAFPEQGPHRALAQWLIPGLYLSFRWLTGLAVQRLPNHGAALCKWGFTCGPLQLLVGGILRSELWCRNANPGQQSGPSAVPTYHEFRRFSLSTRGGRT
jgi:SAM-dependent methyltransferase